MVLMEVKGALGDLKFLTYQPLSVIKEHQQVSGTAYSGLELT